MDKVDAKLSWGSKIETWFPPADVMRLWGNNQAGIYVAINPVFHENTKLIELGCYYVCGKVSSKDVQLENVQSVDQIANLYTNGLHCHFMIHYRRHDPYPSPA